MDLSKTGMMTKTWIPSPMVKAIVPARIRGMDHNDVIFIHETFIEVKEDINMAYLRFVSIKSDFDGIIRCARSIGNVPRSAVVEPEPCVSQILEQAMSSETERKMSPAESKDAVIGTSHQLPPQMLVMTISYDEEDMLVFLFARPSSHLPEDSLTGSSKSNATLDFASAKSRLSPTGKPAENLGKHLAIDPVSRAVAVGAQEGRLRIFKMKPWSIMEDEFGRNGDLHEDASQLVMEDSLRIVEGIILLMEFLFPPKNDPNSVVLQLVEASPEKGVRLLLYQWDHTKSLASQSKPPTVYRLDEDQPPILLIPLAFPAACVLVWERKMVTYSNLVEGSPQSTEVLLAPDERPEEPGSSPRFPIYTAWARPQRREGWTDPYDTARKLDAIYFCREDGFVKFTQFSLKNGGPIERSEHTSERRLNHHIDGAFAALDEEGVGSLFASKARVKHSSKDRIVFAGSMCDGGIMETRPRGDFELKQIMPNWGPLTDFTIVRPPPYMTQGADMARIFACTGRGERHGAVCELRHGIAAQILDTASINIGLTDLFVLPAIDDIGTITGLYLIVAYLDRTRIIFAHLSPKFNLSEEKPAAGIRALVKEDESTVAAAETMHGFMVVITERAVRVLAPSTKLGEEVFEDANIARACIDSQTEVIMVALNQGINSYISCGRWSEEGGRLSYTGFATPSGNDRLEISARCTSMYLQAVENRTLAVIGTHDGELTVFHVNIQTSELQPMCQYSFDEAGNCCDSVAILASTSGSLAIGLILACGLRDGSLRLLELFLEQRKGEYASRRSISRLTIIVDHRETLHLGKTSVSVSPSHTSHLAETTLPTAVIVMCGRSFFSVRYVEVHGGQTRADLQTICFADTGDGSLDPISITKFTQCGAQHARSDMLNSLAFCSNNQELMMISFDHHEEPRPLPRRTYLGGTPCKIIYSPSLERLIVGFTMIKTMESFDGATRSDGSHHTRMHFPTLAFINPNQTAVPEIEDPVSGEDSKEAPRRFASDCHNVGNSGGRVLGIMEWSYAARDGKSDWLLVVNLILRQPNEANGQIGIFKALRGHQTDQIELSTIQLIDTVNPVLCVASYGPRTLIYCSGNGLFSISISMNTPDTNTSDTLLDAEPIQHSVPPAFHGYLITIHGDIAYITTTQHAVLIFHITADGKRLNRAGALSKEKLIPFHTHINFPQYSLTLASTRSRTLWGFWNPSESLIKRRLRPIFEAQFFESLIQIDKFPRATIRAAPRNGPIAIASTFSGAVHNLTFLSAAGVRLFRFVQHLAEQDRILCPITYDKERRRHVDLQIAYGSLRPPLASRHVNGDLLQRLLDRGGVRLLMYLLSKEPLDKACDFTSAEERQQVFTEMAMTAWEESDQKLTDERNVYEIARNVVGRLAELLDSGV